MNLANWLYQCALARPEAPALRLGEQLIADYRGFACNAIGMAEVLKQSGIIPGDRVTVFLKNCPAYLEILYAIWWLGAVAVPVNAKLHPAEAEWIVVNAQSKILISDTPLSKGLPAGIRVMTLAQLDAAAVPVERVVVPASRTENDIAWLFYTSGTTGRPKGVMLSHGNLLAMSLNYALDVQSVAPEDHALYAAPMSHGAGLYNFAFVRAGACHVVPESSGFNATEILDLCEALGNVSFFAAPTMVKRLVETAKAAGRKGEGIRTISYGGGPMYGADISAALELMGPKFVQIYGQGESPMTITVLPRDLVADTTRPGWQKRRDSVGYPQACVTVRVVDEAMQDLPVGGTGEVVVSGPTVMQGYWNNPTATEESLQDGWLRTGDLGHLDADGFLTLTDRRKDVIISGGTNIYPREVEEVLARHPAVLEVSVIGVPDPEWGENVLAVVAPRAGADCQIPDLDAWCRSQIAAFKRPKHWLFVKALPKNSYGKVLKTELRSIATETSKTQAL